MNAVRGQLAHFAGSSALSGLVMWRAEEKVESRGCVLLIDPKIGQLATWRTFDFTAPGSVE